MGLVDTRTRSNNAVDPIGKYLCVFSLALLRVLGVADLLILLFALGHELGLAHLLEGLLALLSELGVAVVLVYLLAHLGNIVTQQFKMGKCWYTITFSFLVSHWGTTCSVQMMSHFLGSLLKIFLKPSRSLELDVCSARRRVERRSRVVFMINPGQTQVGIDSGISA